MNQKIVTKGQCFYQTIYKNAIAEWICKAKKKEIHPNQCFQEFIHTIYNHLKLQIIFDAEIVQVIKNLKNLYDSKQLIEISKTLLEKRFIYERQYLKCISYLESMIPKIERFLEEVKSNLADDTQTIFKRIFDLGIIQFCKIILIQKQKNILVVEILGYLENIIYNLEIKDIYVEMMHMIINNFNNINQELQNIVSQNSLEKRINTKQKMMYEIQFIGDLLNKFRENQNIYFYHQLYGSFINGFGIVHYSDIDISIHIEDGHQLFLDQLHQFLQKKLLLSKFNKVPKLRLISFNYYQLNFDLCLNNTQGVRNSKLLYRFSELNPSVRALGILLKMWGNKSKLIDKTRMSSYGLILMLLYYLIKTEQIFPLIYENEQYTIKQVSDFSKPLISNLYQFFDFYSRNGQFFKSNKIIALDLDQSNVFIDENKLFWIKDPYKNDYNPARIKIEDKEFMHQVFETAKKCIYQLQEAKVLGLFI